jgi:hypothetical protein
VLLLIRAIGYGVVEMFIDVGIHCCLSRNSRLEGDKGDDPANEAVLSNVKRG